MTAGRHIIYNRQFVHILFFFTASVCTPCFFLPLMPSPPRFVFIILAFLPFSMTWTDFEADK